MAETQQRIQRCAVCDNKLEDRNGWKLPGKFGDRYTPYCSYCMEKVYKHYAATLGYKLAMWFCCGMFNMPYRPELLEEAKTYAGKKGAFGGYLVALRSKGYDKRAEGFAGFEDGITDITKAFGGEYATLDVTDEMLEDEEYLDGKLTQEEMWGSGPTDMPYDQDDYEKLNEYYEAMAKNRPGAGPQTMQAMQKIARWTLEQDRCFEKGDYANVEKLQKIIKDEKENEQLRKKDELPQDTVRIDDIVHAIEDAGIPLMGPDEVWEHLANHSLHKRYPYTRDAADQMLLQIRNTTAWNEGHAEVASLPPENAIIDDLDEFAEEQDETEKAIYKELQLIPMNLRNPAEDEE